MSFGKFFRPAAAAGRLCHKKGGMGIMCGKIDIKFLENRPAADAGRKNWKMRDDPRTRLEVKSRKIGFFSVQVDREIDI